MSSSAAFGLTSSIAELPSGMSAAPNNILIQPLIKPRALQKRWMFFVGIRNTSEADRLQGVHMYAGTHVAPARCRDRFYALHMS